MNVFHVVAVSAIAIGTIAECSRSFPSQAAPGVRVREQRGFQTGQAVGQVAQEGVVISLDATPLIACVQFNNIL